MKKDINKFYSWLIIFYVGFGLLWFFLTNQIKPFFSGYEPSSNLDIYANAAFLILSLCGVLFILHLFSRSRTHFEDELQRTEAFFRGMVENSEDLVASFDASGALSYLSPSVERILGYKPDFGINRSIYDFIHPEDQENARQAIAKAIQKSGTTHSLELRLKDNQGNWRLFQVYGKMLPNGSSGPVAIVNCWDLTGRLEADAQQNLNLKLKHKTEELQNANRELEAFTYSVSHDLKAPITRIAGFSSLLKEDYQDKLDDDGKTYLQHIEDGVGQMREIIDALLELARLSRKELKVEPVDLSRLAEEIMQELKSFEPGRQAEVIIPPKVIAYGDKALLKVALTNLLGNAWKFTAKKPQARIEFGVLDSTGGRGQIYFVKDNGVGFSMDDAEQLFIPFKRLHSPEEFSGSGIGLSTVQRIIARQGGKIWAESSPDLGATFYFTLI